MLFVKVLIQAQKFAKIKHTLQQHYKQQRDSINDIVAALVSRHWQKMEDKKADSIMLLNYVSVYPSFLLLPLSFSPFLLYLYWHWNKMEQLILFCFIISLLFCVK
jgi:hypothetical protein